jgi:hypothetical protein
MALNCNLDLNLKALEDKKAELNAQMANLAANGQAGMTDLIAKANAQKEALQASLPAIPEVPNFQKEFDDLKTRALAGLGGTDLHKRVMELEKKWGNAVPDIGGLLDNFSDPTKLLNLNSLDPCSAIPNISGKQLPDGTFAPIENPPESKVQTTNAPDVKEAEPTPVKAESVVIETERKSNTSDINSNLWTRANNKIVLSRVATQKPLVNKIKPINKQIKKQKLQIRKINDNTVPKEFKDKYDNKVSSFEYFLLETVPIPKIYDEYIEAWVKRNAYKDMFERITKVTAWILKFVGYPRLASEGEAWGGTGWNKDGYDYEKLVSKFIYDNAGFGIQVNLPDYGLKLKNYAKTQDAKQYIQKSFTLAPNNYTAAFEPKFQNLTTMRNSTNTSEELEYSNILWDSIRTLFDVEYNGRNAMKIMAAWGQGVNYSDVSIPTADYFIPKTLGGKLTPYEDYIAATVDSSTMNASQMAYSQASFKPHYMYKKEGTNVRTVFARSYQEHIDLATLGYGHNIPT